MHGQSTRAGGCLLAFCIVAGLVAGIAAREPTRGAVIGTGVGVLIAFAMWLLDRRREN